jgi:hypothetical protein
MQLHDDGGLASGERAELGLRRDRSCGGTRVLVVALELISLS